MKKEILINGITTKDGTVHKAVIADREDGVEDHLCYKCSLNRLCHKKPASVNVSENVRLIEHTNVGGTSVTASTVCMPCDYITENLPDAETAIYFIKTKTTVNEKFRKNQNPC